MTYNRRDWLTAAALFLVIAILATCAVTTGVPDWGDDFAAYINEGMAIADGRFQEQAALNYVQHPTTITRETKENRLVYVWGYPLAQAVVYKLVGFDREGYSSVIWYKAPLVVSLALLAGVLYLLFRRRFSWEIAIFLSLLFCVTQDFYEAINRLYADIPFLFISCLTLLLMECYADGDRGWVLGLFYGVALWLTHETRLNGMAVCSVAAIGHVLRRGKDLKQKHAVWVMAFPYLIFLMLTLISERLWLAPATSNLSEVGTADAAMIREHIQYYWKMIVKYLSDLPGMTIPAVGYIMALSAIIGIVAKGFAKENIHLTLLMFGTLVVDVVLPYTQGLRYLYNFLPILLMYAVYGVTCILGKLSKIIRDKKVMKTVGLTVVCIIAAEMLFFSLAAQITRDYINLKNRGAKNTDDVYSDAAIEAYQYIRKNTPEDAVIAFAKPRALYMNTQRQAFRPGINGHEVTDADYFLFCKLKYGDFPDIDPMTVRGKIIADNERFTLYKME